MSYFSFSTSNKSYFSAELSVKQIYHLRPQPGFLTLGQGHCFFSSQKFWNRVIFLGTQNEVSKGNYGYRSLFYILETGSLFYIRETGSLFYIRETGSLLYSRDRVIVLLFYYFETTSLS